MFCSGRIKFFFFFIVIVKLNEFGIEDGYILDEVMKVLLILDVNYGLG